MLSLKLLQAARQTEYKQVIPQRKMYKHDFKLILTFFILNKSV